MDNLSIAYNIDQLDISPEQWREYIFSNDFSYRIENPIILYIQKENHLHRVIDKSNISHSIQPGWKILRWKK
jgi:hypothetical protein